ncbi:MAG: SIS domain-containing protein [Candidatus Falkowbacteria bacterium]
MLDNLEAYKKFDQSLVGDSISSLPQQIAQVINELDQIKIPSSYSNVTHIVVNGMGGSNLGANIIKTVFAKELKVPMTITPGYHVPGFVDHRTLYILSSYSGSTEEVLSVYHEVKKRGAKIIAIAAKEDNKLQRLIAKDKIPAYLFEPKVNPSNQPRLGVGYSIFGMVALISATGVINVKPKDLTQIITDLEKNNKSLTPSIATAKNKAKKIANEFFGHMPIMVGAEHLVGNMMAFRNQLCENSKNFAQYLILPDMNHFAMEGLAHPKSNKTDILFLFLESELYSPRLIKRIALTKAVVKKNGIKVISHKLTAGTKIGQAFEMLQLGEWITYYLALLNGVDPVQIKWVDWFKKELEKLG